MHTDTDRTLALAGTFQAARLTRDLARSSRCDNDALESTLTSLFAFEAPNVAAVFGGIQGAALGLRCLIAQLDHPAQRDMEITRYTIDLAQLARQLLRDGTKMTAMRADLLSVQTRVHDFALTDTTRYSQIAGIYQNHVSPMRPTIMVRGEPIHLNNSETAARIRCVLLGGIRAAVLWRQCGGRRRTLLFQRKSMVRSAYSLLEQLDA